jgi:hypothetical protein
MNESDKVGSRICKIAEQLLSSLIEKLFLEVFRPSVDKRQPKPAEEAEKGLDQLIVTLHRLRLLESPFLSPFFSRFFSTFLSSGNFSST